MKENQDTINTKVSQVGLIINADDLGKSEDVNDAIMECFRNGYISSSTLLVNMPAFEDAISKLTNLDSQLIRRTGIHINLTEGIPLTDEIKKCPRFTNSDGCFSYDRAYPLFYLSFEEKAAIIREITAQISKCLNYGITPDHIDSHHHVHTEWALGQLFVQVAKSMAIRKIRISRNIGPGISTPKYIYKTLFNYSLISYHNLKSADYFGNMDDFMSISESGRIKNSIYEIMVHPNFVNGILSDYKDQLFLKKLNTYIHRYPLMSYNEI